MRIFQLKTGFYKEKYFRSDGVVGQGMWEWPSKVQSCMCGAHSCTKQSIQSLILLLNKAKSAHLCILQSHNLYIILIHFSGITFSSQLMEAKIFNNKSAVIIWQRLEPPKIVIKLSNHQLPTQHLKECML